MILAVCLGGSQAGCFKIGEALYAHSPLQQELQATQDGIKRRYPWTEPTFYLANLYYKQQITITYSF